MRQAEEVKQMRRPRLQQTKDTYKVLSAGNIPTTNVLVKSRRSLKHALLSKQGQSSKNMYVDGVHKYHSKDDIEKMNGVRLFH